MSVSDTSKIKVIGVAGGSASGKTTIVNIIREHFGDNLAVLSHDSYYKAHNELNYEERSRLNYDHPDSFETDMMVKHVRMTKRHTCGGSYLRLLHPQQKPGYNSR